MAQIYTKKCDICGKKALRRDSFLIGAAISRKQSLVCQSCGKTLKSFLKKNGLAKTIHPKATGSRKARVLKTKRKK